MRVIYEHSGAAGRMLDDYVAWLRDKSRLRAVGAEWVEITTPYLDRHNDYLQIYVKRQGATYLLTDDGYVLEDLAQSGCTLDSPKRQALLQMTLAGFGVHNRGGRLEVQAAAETFALRKHNLVQAMLAVSDLFYTRPCGGRNRDVDALPVPRVQHRPQLGQRRRVRLAR